MKKLSNVLVLIVFSLGIVTVASAQARFGVKAGLNLANVSGDEVEDNKMLPTFMVGGVAEFGLGGSGLGLGVGLQLHGKGAKFDDGTETGSVNPFYLQIPVQLTYRNSGIFVGAGPYAAFGIGGKTKFGSDSESISFGSSEDSDLSSIDFGAGLELGYEFSQFRATASYNLGLSNIIPKDYSDVTVKHNVIGISLAYLFGGE